MKTNKIVPKLILLIGILLSMQLTFAQTRITGTVVDEDKSPLPGVTVSIKGTSIGTISDMDGNYEILVTKGQVVEFRFIGYKLYDIAFNGSNTVLNVQLEQDVEQIKEVVVTALGIKQERKAINYAVQDVKSDDILASKQENLVNSLNGKIAGVMITSSSGSPGASSQILIRGATSASEDINNQPLFIVDGMPIDNSASYGGGNRAMDINPNDIESISVLKGPAASALYGLEAANGAIIITTKSGASGKTKVDYNSNISLQQVFKLPPRQQTYMQGTSGYYDNAVNSSWGPLFNPGMQKYNNIDNFFQTGIMHKHDISVSGGNAKSNFLASANYMDQVGVVPAEQYTKFGGLIKGAIAVNDKLIINASTNLINSVNQRSGYGSMYTVYNWPLNDNMENFLNPDGTKRWLVQRNPGDEWINSENPYWRAENNSIQDEVIRNISQLSFEYKPFTFLSVNYRLGSDITNQHYTSITAPQSAGSLENFEGKITDSQRYFQKSTSTLNINFNRELKNGLSFNLLVGNNIQMESARTSYIYGIKFKNPDLNSINNMEETDATQFMVRRRIYGYYGDFKIDYKDFAYLEITGRQDWSSTLPKSNNTFFYPSVSGGLTITKLIWPTVDNRIFTYGKIRGSWAQVGKDAPAQRLTSVLENHQTIGGGFKYDYYAGNPNLKPESTKAWEIGTDLRFFGGKTRLDITYYNMTSVDQIIQSRISPASGWIILAFNAGSVQNKGLEIIFEQNIIKNKNLSWNINFNISGNRSIVIALPSFVSRLPVTAGQLISAAKPTSLLNEPLLAIEGTVYLRNENNQLVMDEYGYPRIGTYLKDEGGNYVLNSDGTRKIDNTNVFLGNREPDAIIGITNTITYKRFDLSFMFDFRKGGTVLNATNASLISSGNSAYLEQYRNKVVTFNGVIENEDGSFSQNDREVVLNQSYFNNYIGVGENFVEDASWIRLRYVTLSYSLNQKHLKQRGIENIQMSVSARNLLLITPYSGGDPETNYAGSGIGGAGTIGLDYFSVPAVQSLDFSVRFSF